MKLQPIGEWGTVIPFADLKTNLKRTFEKIIEKYWNHLGGTILNQSCAMLSKLAFQE